MKKKPLKLNLEKFTISKLNQSTSSNVIGGGGSWLADQCASNHPDCGSGNGNTGLPITQAGPSCEPEEVAPTVFIPCDRES